MKRENFIRQMNREELVDMFTTLTDCASCPAGSNECYEKITEEDAKDCCRKKMGYFFTV